jgi:hypothetical protein
VSIEEDECLVSFDVTALFPNKPIDLTLTLLKRWLKLHITENNTINAYVELAKLCMQENFFQFNGQFYNQKFTHEIEEDGALCFLDTKIKRKLDGTLEFEIFRTLDTSPVILNTVPNTKPLISIQCTIEYTRNQYLMIFKLKKLKQSRKLQK